MSLSFFELQRRTSWLVATVSSADSLSKLGGVRSSSLFMRQWRKEMHNSHLPFNTGDSWVFVVPYYFGHYFMILYCLHNYMALASFENQASVQLAYIVCSHPYCWRPLCLLLLCGFINAGQFEMYSVSYMKNYFSVKYVSFNSNYTKIIGHKNLYHEDFPSNKI